MSIRVDYLIVGAGIIGINIALELRRRFPNAVIALADKEAGAGHHASGRNSGVLHAGFYYPADSLKARFTREGNRLMREYCLEHGLPINPCGKLVVAVSEQDLAGVEQLKERARANQVILESMDPATAKKMEPALQNPLAVLYAPATAVIDPKAVMASQLTQAATAGIKLFFHAPFRGRTATGIRIGHEVMTCGYFINAAGLYADQIARNFGFSKDMAILPFKGLYLKLGMKPDKIRTHIYPVPDLNNPFLGVHYTVTVDGGIKIGPTALPALWREHYRGWSGFNPIEMMDILVREGRLFLNNRFGFRHLALQEMKKMSKRTMLQFASALAIPPGPIDAWHWGPAGIRAQLIRLGDHSLVMDFHFEGDQRSFHILNAVSPGLTCSIPFARHACDRIASLMAGNT
ncbi:MAG: L-2-hydroxyglutarate oxidase [Magnetococcales bacterium]|nr:L-2-hydroxyglutarate oxidase [Magnetococcales bacterium]MBF0150537.1 L-2-hydroxyglutarate oxidase [Magnetococcales bacterium]MBF0174774.1 L-2-hydroxyglutarate oxidase [Magnetococcales bacterium]